MNWSKALSTGVILLAFCAMLSSQEKSSAWKIEKENFLSILPKILYDDGQFYGLECRDGMEHEAYGRAEILPNGVDREPYKGFRHDELKDEFDIWKMEIWEMSGHGLNWDESRFVAEFKSDHKGTHHVLISKFRSASATRINWRLVLFTLDVGHSDTVEKIYDIEMQQWLFISHTRSHSSW